MRLHQQGVDMRICKGLVKTVDESRIVWIRRAIQEQVTKLFVPVKKADKLCLTFLRQATNLQEIQSSGQS